MKRLSKVLLVLVFLLVLCGCNEKNNNKEEQKEENNKCTINNNIGDYLINESMVCPEFKNIKSSGDRLFVTNNGELYEYSDKLYSTTNTNCKKVETDIKINRIIVNVLVGEDGSIYYYDNGNLNRIDKDKLSGYSWYFIVKTYGFNNSVFYLDRLDINDPDILGYVVDYRVYSIYYDYKNNKTKEELIYEFESGEEIEKTTNGFITTNKAIYKYGVTNKDECGQYEDIECKYGLVKINTRDECSNIYYVSNDLIITNNMIK